jgi:5-formyltetrahydrofolate cyclo-ligase
MSLRRRDSLGAAECRLWSHRIQQRVLRFFPYLWSRSVALYSPIGKEVATEQIRNHALRSGKKVFYPRLGDGGRPVLARVESAGELRPGRYGILEPTGTRLITAEDQERCVVFIPGLAFDTRGNRLGRGKGWYDRALEALEEGVVFVALAFEFQVLERVPAERWDRRVHHIITERRIIVCGETLSPSKPIR